ncbi:hypothetical protein V5F32_18500 [Xanthobacter oligotrophicus]|uniref:Integrase n=1 Tax=Xanthobacter oligotrophicus TaxID=2607286 RepID=A0ABW6ZZI3_9HYPH
MRIHFDPADPFHPAKIAAKCRVLQAEMLTWQRDGSAPRAAAFDGTFRSLIRIYETERSSPFHDLKERSRGFYLYGLRLLDQTIGTARVDAVSGVELRRLYQDLRVPAPLTKKQREAGKTKASDGARRAYTAIQMLRVVVNYGRTLKLDACDVLGDILSKMEFQGVRRRANRMTYEQVCAFRKAAHEAGRPSIALGITLQFALGMRQRDVIGEWVTDQTPEQPGIVFAGMRWADGLSFEHITGTVLKKRTSKTGKVVEHDLAQLPDTLAELERIPADRRIGPLVVDEENGLPYKRRALKAAISLFSAARNFGSCAHMRALRSVVPALIAASVSLRPRHTMASTIARRFGVSGSGSAGSVRSGSSVSSAMDSSHHRRMISASGADGRRAGTGAACDTSGLIAGRRVRLSGGPPGWIDLFSSAAARNFRGRRVSSPGTARTSDFENRIWTTRRGGSAL